MVRGGVDSIEMIKMAAKDTEIIAVSSARYGFFMSNQVIKLPAIWFSIYNGFLLARNLNNSYYIN